MLQMPSLLYCSITEEQNLHNLKFCTYKTPFTPSNVTINKNLTQLYNMVTYNGIIFHMFLFAKQKKLQINANSNALLFYAMAILLLFYQALCHITQDLQYGLPSVSPRGGRLLSDFFWSWCTTRTLKTLPYTNTNTIVSCILQHCSRLDDKTLSQTC